MEENKLYTFWSLLKETNIVIPKVQRDYAYGRTDEKAKDVRTKMLDNIHDSLSGRQDPIIMDFVYGSKVEGEGMIPLDGQQRLTTLFLIHLYIAKRDGKDAGELSRFTYATRTSASEFCSKLVNDKIKIDWSQKPSPQITDSNEFLPSYEDDPTIRAMLVTLDDIQAKFSDITDAWEKLTDTDNPCVQFYFLQLDKFGLSDDLYVKMNSRGKPLTEYEIMKSDFEGYLKQLKEHDDANNEEWQSLISDFENKIDTTWTDMLWQNADNDVTKVDNGFINLFQIIFRIRYNLVNTDTSITKKLTYRDSIKTVDDLKFLLSFMDTFESCCHNGGFQQFWDQYFYVSQEAVGRTDRIRLFGRSQDNILVTGMQGKFTNADYVLAYGIYLVLKNNVGGTAAFSRLRILRNLLTNSENELRGVKVGTMLRTTEGLIINSIIPTDGFNTYQIEEENRKAESDNASLLKYENHDILRGSLKLFIDNGKTALLEKFEHLFGNDYAARTPELRAELFKYGDYSQYFNQQTDRRCLINAPGKWHSFFTFNSTRNNQNAILDCLEQCPDNIVQPYNTCLPPTDWRYYMIKYDTYAYKGGQGMYNWDNRTGCPLIINVLNSRSHTNKPNNGYIEWNLLNLILTGKHGYNNGISLNPHSSSPIEIKDTGISVTAVQNGWLIKDSDNKDNLTEKLSAKGFNIIDSVFQTDGEDFITEGEKLLNEIIRLSNKQAGEK